MHAHFSHFSYRYGVLYYRGFIKALYKKALLWGHCNTPLCNGLHKVPIEGRLCKAPRGFVHTYICTFWSFFPTDTGVASLQRLCKAPLWKELHYGGFAKPLYRRGFTMEALQSHLYRREFAKPCYRKGL